MLFVGVHRIGVHSGQSGCGLDLLFGSHCDVVCSFCDSTGFDSIGLKLLMERTSVSSLCNKSVLLSLVDCSAVL